MAEIERIEMEAWADCYAAAPGAFARRFGLSLKRKKNFALFAIGKSPKTLFNRSLGIGVGQSVDKATLEEGMAWLCNHCGPTWAVSIAAGAQPFELSDWLSNSGLTQAKPGIAKFRCDATGPVKIVNCAYDVRSIGAKHAIDFGVTVRRGFELDEGFDTWLATLCGRPYWRTYVAYDGSTPAGVGAMFIKNGSAWLGMCTTLPDESLFLAARCLRR